jgi:ABC-type uncharacterized transport system permease subunit
MYRFNVIMMIVLTGITIYLLTLLWRAAYGDRTEVDGIAIGQMLVYLTIANLQLRFLSPEMDVGIQERIREGQIGFDLNRPVGYPSQLMAGAAGEMIGLLPMLLVALPVALVVGELQPPESVGEGVAYLASLALAWLVAVELNLLIGLTSFWTLEMTGFRMMYRLIGNFATGALIPLWFMPDLLRSIVQLLPFQAIAFIPVSIYVGEPATGSIWSALALQAMWMGLLVLVIRLVWRHAFRHTVIQGG